jgi:hypothetical protein
MTPMQLGLVGSALKQTVTTGGGGSHANNTPSIISQGGNATFSNISITPFMIPSPAQQVQIPTFSLSLLSKED